jgi:hypothetical protein
MSTGALAADLDDEGPPPYRHGSAYDDPRYADIYRYPDRPTPPYAGKYRPPAAVYRDEDDDDYGPPPRRHSYADRGPGYADRCVPRAEIKHRLLRQGWHDYDPNLRGDLARTRAPPERAPVRPDHRPPQWRDRQRPAAGAAPLTIA